MRKDYEKLFSRLESPEPPAELLGKIIARIQKEKQFIFIKKRLFFFSTVMLVSTVALIPTINVFQEGLTQSGLLQFISLFASDFGLVIADWQNFGLAILESLPVMNVIAFLFAALVFLWSLKHLAQATRVVFNKQQLVNG